MSGIFVGRIEPQVKSDISRQTPPAASAFDTLISTCASEGAA